MQEIRLYTSPWKGVKLIALSSVFVIPSIYFLWHREAGDDAWILWVSLGFFGLGYPAGIFLVLNRTAQVIITSKGIFDKRLVKEIIPWDIVTDAYLYESRSLSFLCLSVDRSRNEVVWKRARFGKATRWNEALGLSYANISLTNLRADPGKLLKLIHHILSAGEHDRDRIVAAGVDSPVLAAQNSAPRDPA